MSQIPSQLQVVTTCQRRTCQIRSHIPVYNRTNQSFRNVVALAGYLRHFLAYVCMPNRMPNVPALCQLISSQHSVVALPVFLQPSLDQALHLGEYNFCVLVPQSLKNPPCFITSYVWSDIHKTQTKHNFIGLFILHTPSYNTSGKIFNCKMVEIYFLFFTYKIHLFVHCCEEKKKMAKNVINA